MWKFTPSFFDLTALPPSVRRCGSATAGGSLAAGASARAIRATRPASLVLDFSVTSMASREEEKPVRSGLSRGDDRTHQTLTQINFAYPPPTVSSFRFLFCRGRRRAVSAARLKPGRTPETSRSPGVCARAHREPYRPDEVCASPRLSLRLLQLRSRPPLNA